MRTGVMAQKIGMTNLFLEDKQVPVTVLRIDSTIISHRTQEKDGYKALQVGFGDIRLKNMKKPQRQYFEKQKMTPRRHIVEFRVQEDGFVPVGSQLKADHFIVGQKVDLVGVSQGKGFAGGMKRHNFGGLRATHGVSLTHRSLGSTGACQDPGRVFKGKKMAGHMGARRVTLQNLEIALIDESRGLIFVKGAVPGAKTSFVQVKDAVKKVMPEGLPFPASFASLEGSKPAATKKVEEKVAEEEKTSEVVSEAPVAEKETTSQE